jgi:hypothetical protein
VGARLVGESRRLGKAVPQSSCNRRRRPHRQSAPTCPHLTTPNTHLSISGCVWSGLCGLNSEPSPWLSTPTDQLIEDFTLASIRREWPASGHTINRAFGSRSMNLFTADRGVRSLSPCHHVRLFARLQGRSRASWRTAPSIHRPLPRHRAQCLPDPTGEGLARA